MGRTNSSKKKGTSSDLKLTGQWGVVVRRIMNGMGVLKAYLVQSRKYAYRMNFTRAVTPDWMLEELNDITDATMGFEEDSPLEEEIEKIEKLN
jgi:hypothetical protein